MPSLPQLVATEPIIIPSKEQQEIVTVIPAVEEKIYNKYWLTQFSIISSSATEEARLVASLVPARDVTVVVDGEDVIVKELMPDAEPTVIVVNNLFERMASRDSLAMAMGLVLNELIVIGQEKGILQ